MDVCGTYPRGFISRNKSTPTTIGPVGSNAHHTVAGNTGYSAAATINKSTAATILAKQGGGPTPGCLVVSGSVDRSVCVFRAVFGTGLRLFRRLHVACSPTGSPGALVVGLPVEDEREMGNYGDKEQEASRNNGSRLPAHKYPPIYANVTPLSSIHFLNLPNRNNLLRCPFLFLDSANRNYLVVRLWLKALRDGLLMWRGGGGGGWGRTPGEG